MLAKGSFDKLLNWWIWIPLLIHDSWHPVILENYKSDNEILTLNACTKYVILFYLFVFSISPFYTNYVLLSYFIHVVLTLANSVISKTHGVLSVNYSEIYNFLRHIIVDRVNWSKTIFFYRYIDQVNCKIIMQRIKNASYNLLSFQWAHDNLDRFLDNAKGFYYDMYKCIILSHWYHVELYFELNERGVMIVVFWCKLSTIPIL